MDDESVGVAVERGGWKMMAWGMGKRSGKAESGCLRRTIDCLWEAHAFLSI